MGCPQSITSFKILAKTIGFLRVVAHLRFPKSTEPFLIIVKTMGFLVLHMLGYPKSIEPFTIHAKTTGFLGVCTLLATRKV